MLLVSFFFNLCNLVYSATASGTVAWQIVKIIHNGAVFESPLEIRHSFLFADDFVIIKKPL